MYISVFPSLPSTPRRVPFGHGTKSSILYVHSPTVRPKDIVRLSGDPLIQDSLNVRASTMIRACLYYDTCPSLHDHGSSLQPANRPIVCTYTFATKMTTLRMLRAGGS